MTRSSRLLTALIGIDVVIAALALRGQHDLGKSWTFLVSDLAAGAAMCAAGTLIWRRRPQNRSSWLLLGASVTWWIGDFEHARDRNAALFGFAFSRWWSVFLAWAVLAFPSGRLHRRFERSLVAALVAIAAARSLSRVFLFVPADVAGYGTRNRFLPIDDDRWWRIAEDWHARALTVGIIAMVCGVVQRWVMSSRTSRQMLTPAVLSGTLLALGVVYEYQIGWNAGVGPDGDLRIYYVVWWAYGALALALSVGMVRLRRTRSAVVDVLSEMSDNVPPARLGPALARALGDPSLTLLPWSPATGTYVDASGTPVELAVDNARRAVTRIERDGEPMAALIHDAALLEDPGLVNAVVATVRLTIDNDQLQAALEQQLIEVAASRNRIVEAGDAERRRIERNLHDGAQQRLVCVALGLQLAGTKLADSTDHRVHEVLAQAVVDVRGAIEELRDLARGIHPSVLTEFGLGAALESLAARSVLPISLDVKLVSKPPDVIASTAYFAVSEALTNALKHAQASAISVRVTGDGQIMHVEVIDDGRGGADLRHGSGLAGIADRIATVGGCLHVVSPAGAGTRFEIELPCVSS